MRFAIHAIAALVLLAAAVHPVPAQLPGRDSAPGQETIDTGDIPSVGDGSVGDDGDNLPGNSVVKVKTNRKPGDPGQSVAPDRGGVADARASLAPTRREEIAGQLVFVDVEARRLELKGEVFALTNRTVVLDRHGKKLDLATFAARATTALADAEADLPLVLVEIRPRPGDLAAVTRITQVTSLQGIRTNDRRILAPLVALDGRIIELLGAAFTVAPAARIAAGTQAIDLAQLATLLANAESGLLDVKLEVRPADADGSLPLVESLVIPPRAGEVEIVKGGAVRIKRVVEAVAGILSISPFDGETGVGFVNDNGDVEALLRIEFSSQIRNFVKDENFLFELFPRPTGRGRLELGRDGRTLSQPAILAPDTPYQLVAGIPGVGYFHSVFTTGTQIPATTLSGSVTIPTDLELDAISPDQSLIVVSPVDPSGVTVGRGDVRPLLASAVAVLPLGPTYSVSGLPLGSYYVHAHVVVDVGRERFVVSGTYDADGDGIADAVEITEAASEVVADIDVRLPEPFAVTGTVPTDREIGVAPGSSTIAITFNRPVGRLESGDDVLIRPAPVTQGPLVLSADGLTASVDVELADETVYSVLVQAAEDRHGDPLAGGYRFTFTTRDAIPIGGIAGDLFLPADLPVVQRIIEDPATVDLIRAGDDADSPSRVFLSRDGSYSFAHVPDGQYRVEASVEVGLPRGLRPGRTTGSGDLKQGPTVPAELASRVSAGGFDLEALKRFKYRQIPNGYDRVPFFGTYDADDDGEPDLVEVADGALVGDIDIYLRLAKAAKSRILRVVSTVPEGGTTGLALDTEISITFNAPLLVRGDFVSLDARLVPAAESGPIMAGAGVDGEGTEVTFPVTLTANEEYRLILSFAEGVEERLLVDAFTLRFDTYAEGVEPPEGGSLSGTVTVSAGYIDDAEVFLYTDSDGEVEVVSVATAAGDGSWAMGDVAAGTYRAYAEVLWSEGDKLFSLYDVDGDGEADDIAVAAGETISGIDIAVTVVEADPLAQAVSDTADTNLIVSLDLNPDPGNHRRSALSGVSPGDQVQLAVYVQDVVEVSGYVLSAEYDPEQLEFMGVREATTDEPNLLTANGGTSVFLPGQLGENTIEFGGALLGATSSTVVSGAGPVAFFTFTAQPGFSGTVLGISQTVLRGLNYKDTLDVPVKAAVTPSIEALQQVKGPVSFDYDTTAGDQGQLNRGFIDAGTEFSVALYLNGVTDTSGVVDLANYGVTVQYEPEQITYIGFSDSTETEANFLGTGGGTVLPLPPIVRANSIEFGNAILGPTAADAPDGKGLIGVLTFQANEAFTQSDLIVNEYSLKSVGEEQQSFATVIIGRVATGEVDLSIPAGQITQVDPGIGAGDEATDFNGDGLVDFDDFFQFADAFGQDAEGDRAPYDLDGNGFIDFDDFFIFADAFGQSAKAVAEPGSYAGTVEVMVRMMEGRVEVRPVIRTEVEYDRVGFLLDFDARLASLQTPTDLEGELVAEVEPGLVLWSAPAPATGTEAPTLFLVPVSEIAAEGLVVTLQAAAIRDGEGTLRRLQPPGAGQPLPTTFHLFDNYPNPFNPATAIRYQLPEASRVRLEIYDALGQRVRTLVNQVQPAGFYSAVWQGRSDGGAAVASGLYFYQFEAGDFREVKKLLLLK